MSEKTESAKQTRQAKTQAQILSEAMSSKSNPIPEFDPKKMGKRRKRKKNNRKSGITSS